MAIFSGVARQHQQTAYGVLPNSLQQEWAFVKCLTLGIEVAFQPMEDELLDTLLPDLFQ